MKTIISVVRFSTILFLMLSCGGFLLSQDFIFQNRYRKAAYADFSILKPFMDARGGDDMSFFSAAYGIYASVPVSEKMNVIGMIPTSYTDYKREGSKGEFKMGNPYIGLQLVSSDTPATTSSYSLGVFLPLASEPGIAGWRANIHDMHKYIDELVTVYMNYGYLNRESEFEFGFEAGPNFLFPTADGGDPEIILHYGLKLGYVKTAGFSAEYNGTFLVTEDPADFGDRFNHVVSLGIFYEGRQFVPSVFYKIYTRESLREYVDGVLGIKLGIIFE